MLNKPKLYLVPDASAWLVRDQEGITLASCSKRETAFAEGQRLARETGCELVLPEQTDTYAPAPDEPQDPVL